MTGAYDQDALDQMTELEFLDNQTRHDCLPGSGIIGDEKSNTGKLQHVSIDSFNLVWKRIHL